MAEGDDVEHLLWLVLKTCRERRGLSQRAAAAKIGVSQPVVARWESGSSAIGEDTLTTVARAYGVSVRELLLEGLAGAAASAPTSPGPAVKSTRPRAKGLAKR